MFVTVYWRDAGLSHVGLGLTSGDCPTGFNHRQPLELIDFPVVSKNIRDVIFLHHLGHFMNEKPPK